MDILENIPAEVSLVELVTLVEVIEHVPLDRVGALCQVVFGQIRPRHVLITTPNKEFNVYFGFDDEEMRHYDHKFEWTRKQFELFCANMGEMYGYQFQMFGVGQHINQSTQKYGYCSQGAKFRDRSENNQGLEDMRDKMKEKEFINKQNKKERAIFSDQ